MYVPAEKGEIQHASAIGIPFWKWSTLSASLFGNLTESQQGRRVFINAKLLPASIYEFFHYLSID
jgi:hypothetical protein